MRDIDNDRNSGKITLVVKMGSGNAKIYHLALLATGMLAAVVFTILNYSSYFQLIYLATFVLMIKNLLVVYKNVEVKQLDPYLKQLAISTLIFSVVFGLGLLF